MQLRKIINDDNAVSPVIGVILMVAITVILAAVIATFVLGLGDQVSNTAPQASFGFDYTETSTSSECTADSCDGDGVLDITHDGGDSIKASELFVRGSPEDGDWSDDGAGEGTSGYPDSEMISAGNTLTVDVKSDDTVRVVYEPEEGGTSATLGEWDGPDA